MSTDQTEETDARSSSAVAGSCAQAEHTPAPWIVSRDASEVFARSSYAEVTVAEVYREYPSEVYMANARLISAAPDLLEALKMMVRHAENGPPDNRRWEEDCSPLGTARRAIAKAEVEA